MKSILSLFALLGIFSLGANAQRLSGTIQDANDQSPVPNATVKILKPDSTATAFSTVTDSKGQFVINGIPSGSYILTVTSVGYSKVKRPVEVTSGNIALGNIAFAKNAETLSTVVISGTPPPVKVKNDTLEMAASQYKVNPDATGEDLIKKMPGITVDKSGTVTAQGETVKKVTVDGRDFFGDDATATLRNLPSEVIDKIQVFDKLSDQAQLTDRKSVV